MIMTRTAKPKLSENLWEFLGLYSDDSIFIKDYIDLHERSFFFIRVDSKEYDSPMFYIIRDGGCLDIWNNTCDEEECERYWKKVKQDYSVELEGK